MKNVLVTGGAGFVGHHLVKSLISIGYNVKVLDNLSTGRKENIDNRAIFVEGDIQNRELVLELTHDCDQVFHLAAFIQLQESIKRPIECFNNNIIGTVNIVQSSIKNKVKKIIFASSSSVYPLYSEEPFSEHMELDGESPYAISKIACERIIEFYCKNSNTSFCSLRFFNIYGKGQNVSSGYAAVIPKFIMLSKAGGDIPLFNGGKQTRDFINVKDAVDAYLKISQSDSCGIYNVGSGTETSIKTIADKIVSIENKSKIVELPKLDGDAIRSLANISKINQSVGFIPKIKFEDVLMELYDEF